MAVGFHREVAISLMRVRPQLGSPIPVVGDLQVDLASANLLDHLPVIAADVVDEHAEPLALSVEGFNGEIELLDLTGLPL